MVVGRHDENAAKETAGDGGVDDGGAGVDDVTANESNAVVAAVATVVPVADDDDGLSSTWPNAAPLAVIPLTPTISVSASLETRRAWISSRRGSVAI